MHADDRFCEFLLTGDMNCLAKKWFVRYVK